jgi:hypothetical protein
LVSGPRAKIGDRRAVAVGHDARDRRRRHHEAKLGATATRQRDVLQFRAERVGRRRNGDVAWR